MSKEPRLLGGLPRGWRVEQPDHDPDRVGGVGVLRRADEASLKAARRHLREIPEKRVEGQGKYLHDTTTGLTLEVITAHTDLTDPASTGAVAFTVRNGWFVALRPLGWKNENDTSQVIGETYGREATGTDPMPVSGLEMY